MWQSLTLFYPLATVFISAPTANVMTIVRSMHVLSRDDNGYNQRPTLSYQMLLNESIVDTCPEHCHSTMGPHIHTHYGRLHCIQSAHQQHTIHS